MGRSQESRATEAAEQGTWLALAWSNLTKANFVKIIYVKAAEYDGELRLLYELLRSFDATNLTMLHRCKNLSAKSLGPLVLTHLLEPNDHFGRKWALAVLFGLDIGEPYISHLTDNGANEHTLRLLAGSPYPEDRDAAFALMSNAKEKLYDYDSHVQLQTDEFMMALGFAHQGDPRGDELLTKSLALFANMERHRRKHDGFEWLMMALEARKDSEHRQRWCEQLVDCLGCGLPAFVTLGELVGEELTPTLRQSLQKYLSSLLDNNVDTRILRVATQSILSRDANEAKALSRKDVDWLREHFTPEMHPQPAFAYRVFCDLLLRIGTEEDLDWIEHFSYTDSFLLLAVVNQVRIQRGKKPFIKMHYSENMLNAILEKEGGEYLFALVEEQHCNGKVLLKLANWVKEHEEHQLRLLQHCKQLLESLPNYPIRSMSDTPNEVYPALSYLQNIPDALCQQHCKDTSSAWIRSQCFGEEAENPVYPKEKEEGKASIAPASDASFANGNAITGLALSPNGERLCAVTSDKSALYDTETGNYLSKADLYGYGTACVFSPSGKYIAIGNRYKNILLSQVGVEGEEGEQELYNHGGEVRCVALNADDSILASADCKGEIIAWDIKKKKESWRLKVRGECHDILVLPDDRVLASYSGKATKKGQSFYLLLIEADGQKSKKLKQDSAVTALVQHTDGRIALGCTSGEISVGHIAKNKFVSSYSTKASHIRALCWKRDELWLGTNNGTLGFIDFAQEENTIEEIAQLDGMITSMVSDADVLYAGGNLGRVISLEGRQFNGIPASHNERLTGWTSLNDGRIVTLDWKGRVLLWASEEPSLVLDLAAASESIAHIDDDTVVVGTRKGMRLINLATKTIIAETTADTRNVVAYDDVIAYSTKENIQFSKVDGLESTPKKIQVGNISAMAVGANGLDMLVGTAGGFVGIWKQGKWRWKHQYHGSDRLRVDEPHKTVCSVALSPDGKLAATGGTDHIVRVLDTKTGAQLLRLRCYFGLWCHLAFDPTSRYLAIPDGSALSIIDIAQMKRTHRIDASSFGTTKIQTAIFAKDGTLYATDENGTMFRVELVHD